MADDVSSRRREVDTIKKRLNIELSTGLNKGDGGYDVVEMEE